MRTLRGGSRELMLAGLGFAGAGGVAAIAAMLTGSADLAGALGRVSELFLLGGGLFAFGALRLPSWARLRRQQMDEIAERLVLPR